MRRTLASVSILALFALAWAGCESRTDQTDSGGVLLSISDFDGLPFGASVSFAQDFGFLTVEEITIENVPVNPEGITSDLMNVEMYSMEVVYTRGDNGTRVPSPFVTGVFGVAPVGGELTIENQPLMGRTQLLNPPLSDLVDFGEDTETGSQVIILNFRVRFFGRTLSGDEVETAPAQFTVDFVP